MSTPVVGETWRRKPGGYGCRVVDVRKREGRALLKSPHGSANWVSLETLAKKWERLGGEREAPAKSSALERVIEDLKRMLCDYAGDSHERALEAGRALSALESEVRADERAKCVGDIEAEMGQWGTLQQQPLEAAAKRIRNRK